LYAVIFANGVFTNSTQVKSAVKTADLVIAADGGARHCLDIGIIPDIVIGDFDSLDADELKHLSSGGSDIIQHPARKDYTDLELALLHALEKGVDEVAILGALGKRWDQTLANILLPASADFANLVIRLLDGSQEVNLLRSRETIILRGRPGDTVSLIPLCGNAQGVRTRGLEYPLENDDLVFGSTRGISNVITAPEASVYLDQGILVCVLIHTQQDEEEGSIRD
jgi:thiamine pyrophosphokinase